MVHDVVDLFRHAPAVGDGDDVAFAQGRIGIVDEDAAGFIEFLTQG